MHAESKQNGMVSSLRTCLGREAMALATRWQQLYDQLPPGPRLVALGDHIQSKLHDSGPGHAVAIEMVEARG